MNQGDWIPNWRPGLTLANCQACDWVILASPPQIASRCPHCGEAALTPLDAAADRPIYTQSPELVVPFAARADRLQQQLTAFAGQGWFAPQDLTPERINGRLQPIYLPMWLVDADVQAQWQAEVGFNYQVVSHREQFTNGAWRTQELRETRVRWELRLGHLQRHYANSRAPALEEQQQIEHALGQYELDKARPFHPHALNNALARLPNRPPADAWPEARAAIQQRAAEECRQAAAADHLRDFRWQAEYSGHNWTQLLYPLYTTYYLDDNGQPHMVFIHGQTGRLVGDFHASMKQAWRWAGRIAMAAAVFLLITMLLTLGGFLEPRLWPVAGVGLTLTLFTGAAAPAPPLMAWYTNNRKTIKAAQQLVNNIVNTVLLA